MSIDYNKIRFPKNKYSEALWSGLNPREIKRFLGQMFHMSIYEIKFEKKKQKLLEDKKSGLCAFVIFRWSKTLTDEERLIIYKMVKKKC